MFLARVSDAVELLSRDSVEPLRSDVELLSIGAVELRRGDVGLLRRGDVGLLRRGDVGLLKREAVELLRTSPGVLTWRELCTSGDTPVSKGDKPDTEEREREVFHCDAKEGEKTDDNGVCKGGNGAGKGGNGVCKGDNVVCKGGKGVCRAVNGVCRVDSGVCKVGSKTWLPAVKGFRCWPQNGETGTW
ncbi:hypothetical protein C0Q70_15631 [Pomacea canaliculata]|uniref:Uncharacterized protein n=1 Tax=Pomacea canaliculata TaxID=400727 RepID=A0A2T7NVE1_POMCA|nr:hypothetical protein C0Q70_15631 [Pomacea canaliculata]